MRHVFLIPISIRQHKALLLSKRESMDADFLVVWQRLRKHIQTQTTIIQQHWTHDQTSKPTRHNTHKNQNVWPHALHGLRMGMPLMHPARLTQRNINGTWALDDERLHGHIQMYETLQPGHTHTYTEHRPCGFSIRLNILMCSYT